MPDFSARAKRAVTVLAGGGRFVRRLETQFRGGDKFEFRLMPGTWRPKQQPFKGYGFKVFHELESAGALVRDFEDSLSGYESYRLRGSL